jgi:hypothetical protein
VSIKNPHLRRFWFPVRGHSGIGVTAYTREEAKQLSEAMACELQWPFHDEIVTEDVDIRTLDQNHVVPNMASPHSHGVWFPALRGPS